MNDIQWFPGHMTKTLRSIEKEVGNVDMIIEVTDARLPESSRSPEVFAASRGKPRLIVINKADLADSSATKRWIDYYKSKNIAAIAGNSTDKKFRLQARTAIEAACAEVTERKAAKGAMFKPRTMIVGVPNAGKSTFINCLAGNKAAKAEDRPGVTRGKQWITLDFVELLDMPGVLRKKFDNQSTAAKLAFTGAISDKILDIEFLAVSLIDVLKEGYPDSLRQRYGIESAGKESYDILTEIAVRRGKLLRKGVADTEQAAIILLDEYRAGKLGAITLEEP